MTRACRLLAAFAFVSGTTLDAQAPTARLAPVQTTAAARDEDRQAYVANGCYQCHGREAQGSDATGPRLGPRPMARPAFGRYVRQPSGQMPPYTAKVLSEADLDRIYRFVEARPAPRPVQEIPLLR
jgi:mono/diheme cytochrome c family protein